MNNEQEPVRAHSGSSDLDALDLTLDDLYVDGQLDFSLNLSLNLNSFPVVVDGDIPFEDSPRFVDIPTETHFNAEADICDLAFTTSTELDIPARQDRGPLTIMDYGINQPVIYYRSSAANKRSRELQINDGADSSSDTDEPPSRNTFQITRNPRLIKEIRNVATIPFELSRAFNVCNPRLFETVLGSLASPSCVFTGQAYGKEVEVFAGVSSAAAVFTRLMHLYPDGVLTTHQATPIPLSNRNKKRYRQLRSITTFVGTRVGPLTPPNTRLTDPNGNFMLDPSLPPEVLQETANAVQTFMQHTKLLQSQPVPFGPPPPKPLLQFTFEMVETFVYDRTERQLVAYHNAYRLGGIKLNHPTESKIYAP